jgi:hypothetical protein
MQVERAALWLLVAIGCACHGGGGDHTDAHPDGDTDTDPDTDPSCDLEVSGDPEIRGDDPLFPLSRAVAVTLSAPARLQVTATDTEGEAVQWESPTALTHDLPLVGLHESGDWTLSIHAIDENGCGADAAEVAFSTDALPTPLPHLDILESVDSAIEPGYTVVPIYTKDISYIALVDVLGRIVWIYGPTPEKFTEIRPLANGHLLALTDIDITEIDWMGVVQVWSSESSTTVGGTPIAEPSFHHDMFWSSRDTIVALSKRTVEIPDFHLSELDSSVIGDAEVGQDLIVEIALDGSVIQEWDVTTMLDIYRLGYDSLTNGQEGLEWSHVNAVDEDVANGRWIVSARNQDCIFAVSQATGEVDWILGNHDNWHSQFADKLLQAEGDDFQWPFHQHAAKYDAATGRVMVFDNGNFRASPWTGDPPMAPEDSYSRIVEYTVDEVGMGVTQDWEFRLDPDVFSFAMGDADWLPNGNVLADFAYVEWEGGQQMEALGRGSNTFRVVEFDPLTGEIAWYLDAWSPLGDSPDEWQAYRTQRIPRPFGPTAPFE